MVSRYNYYQNDEENSNAFGEYGCLLLPQYDTNSAVIDFTSFPTNVSITQ